MEFPKVTESDKESPRSRRGKFIKWGVLIFLLGSIGLLARPSWHILRAYQSDLADCPPVPVGYLDDASALNQTRVFETWRVPEERDQAEEQLAELLRRAQQQGLKVSIAGARHSMGGHSIAPDGIVIDMLPFNRMSYDPVSEVLNVQAGAIWQQVIAHLDSFGRSVAIMQSNDSFSVGGSISVNCHGWQFGKPPISSTVEAFRLMLANGEILRCSRGENVELFELALGGYGLFGIILDVDLQTVPNRRYKAQRVVVPTSQALETFDQHVKGKSGVEMVYARMDISAANFLNETIIYVLSDAPAAEGSLPELKQKGLVGLRRSLFRGSAESDYGKRLRWDAETRLQGSISPTYCSRNQLLSEGVETFANRSAATTDILHEYFVPRQHVAGFVQDLQTILPQHEQDLLNVTVRSIEEDRDTFLRYADQPLFSFVMLFNQARTENADIEMQRLTEHLIAAVLQRNGRYYLPYRLHATREQFAAAYPQGERFFEMKRTYDPEELFVNAFYLKYGRN